MGTSTNSNKRGVTERSSRKSKIEIVRSESRRRKKLKRPRLSAKSPNLWKQQLRQPTQLSQTETLFQTKCFLMAGRVTKTTKEQHITTTINREKRRGIRLK